MADRLQLGASAAKSLLRSMPARMNGNGKHAKPFAGETKALSMSYPAELFFDIADKYLPRDAHAVSAHSAYGLIPLLYSVMKFRATKIVEPSLWISEEIDGAEEWVEDHELAEVLERPNEDMEMADLLEATHTLMDEGGRCLWVKTRDKAGRVARLYPFGAHEFAVEATDDRLYGRFRVSGNRNRLRDFPPEDVVLFRHDWKETSPVNVVLGHLNIGQALRDAIRSQLRRAISPSTTIEFDTPLDQENRDRFKAELTAQFAGAFNTGRPMVLEGAKLNQLPFGLKDLALGPVQSDIEVAVGEAFQMHPALFGARIGVENSGSWADTIESAQNLFYDLYAFPTWARIEKTLTRSLLREVDDNPFRFIRFDKSKVRALQVDQGKRINEANSAANFLSVDERRVYAGWGALEEGDERGEQIGAAAADPFAGLFGKSRRGVPERKSGARRLATKADDPYLDAVTAALDYSEGAWATTIAALLEKDRDAITAIVEGQAKSVPLLDTIMAAVDAYLAGAAADRWAFSVLPLIQYTSDTAIQNLVVARYAETPELDAAHVRRFADQTATELIKNVSDTSRRAVRVALEEGLNAGDPAPKIARRIAELPEFGRARAKLIARTETARAYNGSQFDAMAAQSREHGVDFYKVWVATLDERSRDSHVGIHGERVMLEETFSNGCRYPGDPEAAAAETINCRCVLTYAVKPAKAKRVEPAVINLQIDVPPDQRTIRKEIVLHDNGDGLVTSATVTETVVPEPTKE